MFRHALIRDAAYNSMLKSRRKSLHREIADLIETQYPEVTQSDPAVMANHRQHADQPAQAIAHWQRAARAALSRGANIEAINQLQQALDCNAMLPESEERKNQELDLLCMIGPALMATKGWGAPEPHDAFKRARALCEEVGDQHQSFAALWGIWLFHAAGSDLVNGLDLVNELFRIADEEKDEELELQAHHAAWGTRCWFGDMEVATKHVERGLKLYSHERHRNHAARFGGHDPGVCANAQGALTLWYRGYPDLALRRAKRGAELAHELNHPPSIGHAQLWLCTQLYMRRDKSELQREAAILTKFAKEHALGQYLAQATLFTTWATTSEIGLDAAIEIHLEALEKSRALGHTGLNVFRHVMLAEAILANGGSQEADEHIASAFELIAAPEPHVMTSDLFRLKSAIEIKKVDGDVAIAAQYLRDGLAVTKEQNARSFELRTAVDLARLHLRNGDASQARDVLYPIHDWFTEGFETIDWQTASSLRDEIAKRIGA